MRPKLASSEGLNRSEVGGTVDEFVTLSLHSPVLEEVFQHRHSRINGCVKNNNKLMRQRHQRFSQQFSKKQQRGKLLKKQPKCSNCQQQRNGKNHKADVSSQHGTDQRNWTRDQRHSSQQKYDNSGVWKYTHRCDFCIKFRHKYQTVKETKKQPTVLLRP